MSQVGKTTRQKKKRKNEKERKAVVNEKSGAVAMPVTFDKKECKNKNLTETLEQTKIKQTT